MDFEKTYPKESASKAVNGVWQPMSNDFEVLVAKANNPRFIEISKKVLRPHRVAFQRGAMDDAEITRLTCEVMSKSILLGWRGTAMIGGKPIGDYSPKRAEEVLILKEDFREDITKMSADRTPYADDAIEAELGNSSSTSVGSSGGASSSQ